MYVTKLHDIITEEGKKDHFRHPKNLQHVCVCVCVCVCARAAALAMFTCFQTRLDVKGRHVGTATCSADGIYRKYVPNTSDPVCYTSGNKFKNHPVYVQKKSAV